MSSTATAKLYGAAPILICSVDEPSSVVTLLGATGLNLLLYDPDTQSLHHGEEQLTLPQLQAPPSSLCILFATMAETEKQMEQFRTWWAEQGTGLAPETIRLLPPDAAGAGSFSVPGVALVRNLIGRLAAEIRRVSEGSAQLLRQTVELREELADLRARGDGGGLRLGAVCEPSVPASADDRMTFTFPCPVHGLSQLDLHFSGLGECGTLTVLLNGREPLDGWRVDYGTIVEGWHEFKLLHPAPTHDQRISLTVIWETAKGSHPKLDLSDHITLPFGGAFVDRAPVVVRLPAMRLWYS